MSVDRTPSEGPRRPRAAILGTAHPHLGNHLRALAGRAEVCAVYQGRYPASASLDHTRLRGVPVVTDAASALVHADLALICSTTAEHPELGAVVAQAGLPVLMEKPLAADAAEAEELAGRLTAAGIPAAMAMFLRHAPVLRRARRLLTDGRLGRLIACDARFTHPGLLERYFTGTTAAWMLSPSWGGRGAFADLGVHLVDLLRWLRPDTPIRVRAAVLSPLPAGGAGDAGGTALLEWGPVPATLHTGWTSCPGGIRLVLEGTRGTLHVNGGHLVLTTAKGSFAESHRPPAAGDATTAFLSNPGELAGLHDAVACARVLEAVGEAAA
ncbi:Gfo/Idh/MocA family protein [Streptomyces sp. MUM 16J]|uniref:Gfo/Idh/MocA family protein n=1 Tax=Streptomyces sp. MUM 16J TaxID=2791988 RepID=UPI00069CD62D|nr:Gfo/Idh/MocA family oxidoreductase [Streptomyces sp. MUM 16J]MCH0558136.1 Gfo/Idh/MocA family oxidoreductase [Streptomyces sp. MUM 16J]